VGDINMNDVVFITGATGFLGTQMVRRLIKRENITLIVLVRGNDFNGAYKHLSRAWWEWHELITEIKGLKKFSDKEVDGRKIYLMNGDITQENLGLSKDDYSYLVDNLTHIIHSAADLRLNVPLEDLRKINVQGTLNLLKLAREADKDHKIARFSHLSTAYVAGGQKGLVSENSLTDEHGFLSNYETSKYEGELEVQNSGLPISIFRPGMVVGDSRSGYIKTFNTIYVLIRLYLNKQLSVLPLSKKVKLNLVTVDYVADAVVELTFNQNTEGKVFHLTAPYESLPNVGEFIEDIRVWASNNQDIQLPKPLFMPVYSLIPQISFLMRFLGGNARILSRIMKELAPYMNEDREFLRDNTESFLGKYNFKWEEYLSQILEYAMYNGFFHRSERTVHEQVLFRLKSSSRPVRYYDAVCGKFLQRKPSDVEDEIYKTVKSLKKLGINPGDRVAITGYNSIRYLILDVSIGLLGAVSVPLYYTSPVNEINQLLDDCDARVIFVGTPDLIEHSKELDINNPIISFLNDENDLPDNILSWNNFISLGRQSDEEEMSNEIFAPVDFDDVATIRYTSGTTGDPSGVTFTHRNLRWMAEYVASMPPWIDRTHEVSYLSFLPMNHVVEGILGTYAPYYAPASLKLYFLEDFKDLETILPRVSPTIFFSVPRFYEKVWSKIQQTWIGNMYLGTKNDLIKNILRSILKRSILKHAGLDACAQLIVGSAPVSTELLTSYHELGIEIYNAYGLTEAPLITINKLGSNNIGTVGEPLPKTNIKINEDGEVIVKGPQVASGYFNNENHNLFKNNWLYTGDYGYLTSMGSLIITGRKKELIVNSYGKSISPLKIEGFLKHIYGVSEVMVVGDNKPYCIAFLWVDEIVDTRDIDQAITDVNNKLSNPEKIRRWLILKNDLSIENGDLTANLKLKRSNIIKSHQNIINIIYEDKCREKLSKINQQNLLHYGEEGKP
jgi:long-chain acyl-CoA synthetase